MVIRNNQTKTHTHLNVFLQNVVCINSNWLENSRTAYNYLKSVILFLKGPYYGSKRGNHCSVSIIGTHLALTFVNSKSSSFLVIKETTQKLVNYPSTTGPIAETPTLSYLNSLYEDIDSFLLKNFLWTLKILNFCKNWC